MVELLRPLCRQLVPDGFDVAILEQSLNPSRSIAFDDEGLIVDSGVPVRLLSAQHQIDDLEHPVCNGHDSSLVSPSDHKSFVESLKLALGLSGTVGRFAQEGAHV